MIVNESLENILLNATDISVVCEVYSPDSVPTANGFDPEDALECFAAVSGIVFRTREYKSLVKRFGSIKRTITSEVNSTSIEFSNVSREIAQFEFATGFEGLILVVRLISRSLSVDLTDSQILFAGRCEKPKSGKKDSLSVSTNFILGSLDVNIPRRKFGPDDPEGRVVTDPEFEGFRFMPQYGSVSYSIRVKRGGILGLFGFKKTVLKTLAYSSFSDLEADKYVPEVFGRMQIQGVHIGYIDVGIAIRIRTAFCEGEIEDLVNVRSVDPNFPLSPTSYAEAYGEIGALNGPDDPAWVAPGNYSRTAHIRGQADNSAVAESDPAPDVVGVIFGRLVTTPDPDTEIWEITEWSDNAAAHTRFLLTSEDYGKLDANWIDDDAANEVFDFNAEKIFDMSVNDFVFIPED